MQAPHVEALNPERPTPAAAGAHYTWQNLEFVGGGFVSGLVVHPNERGLMYARTDVGGAYRWDAAGERWRAITDWIGQRDWRYTGVESLAVDPTHSERVYLALGIYNQPKLGSSAIARSSDRGESWQLCEMPFGMGGNEAGRGSGERLAVDPANGDVIFFGSRDRGLWRSADRGASFHEVAGFPAIDTALDNPTPGRWNYLTQAVGIVFVVFVPSALDTRGATARLYAGVSSCSTSLFQSSDGGHSWSAVPGQPTGLRPIRAALSTTGVLFLSYGREPGPNTMFDGAVYAFDTASGRFTNVTPLRPDPENGQTFGYAGIAVDAQNPECVMVATAYRGHAPGSGGDELFRSLDGGRSWRAIGQAGRRDAKRAPWLCFGHSTVHIGHWMYALVIDPFDSERAYYGTGQTIWGTSNLSAVDRGAPSEWSVRALGIEETVPLVLASPEQGAAVLAGTGDISGFAVFEDASGQRSLAMHEPTFKDTTGIDHAVGAPGLVVRVGGRGWNRERDTETGAFSADGGRTWSPFRSYPEGGAHEGQIAVSADGKAWVWNPRGAPATYVSHDASGSWRRCQGLPELPLALLSDRVQPSVFYALEAQGRRLFRSQDGGSSFSAVQGGMPAVGLAAALAVFGHAGHLWASLGGQLFRSESGGERWAEVFGLSAPSHLGVGKAAGGGYPTVFAAARQNDCDGFFRSTDAGVHWLRINDARHQFGQVRAISGDPKRWGRIYIATGGRGVIYGDAAGTAAFGHGVD